jgi:hypothetical protein
MEDTKKLENKKIDQATKIEVKGEEEKAEKIFVNIREEYPEPEDRKGGGFG